jgi:hypothetical protein
MYLRGEKASMWPSRGLSEAGKESASGFSHTLSGLRKRRSGSERSRGRCSPATALKIVVPKAPWSAAAGRRLLFALCRGPRLDGVSRRVPSRSSCRGYSKAASSRRTPRRFAHFHAFWVLAGRRAWAAPILIPTKRCFRRIEPNLHRYLDDSRRNFTLCGNEAVDTDKMRTPSLRQPTPSSLKPSKESEKNVKIVGTNSITPLASTKHPKNELKTNCKRSPNDAEKGAFKTQNRPNKPMGHQGMSAPC